MHLLLLTSEQWPTFRADLAILFGKYLPSLGITCDLVTEKSIAFGNEVYPSWAAGDALLCEVPSNRAGQYIVKFLHQFKVLVTIDYRKYQAVQVRDMTIIALVAIVMCKLKKKSFYYWLSYPQSEGQVERAKVRGLKAGMRFWFPLMQGLIGKWLLYRVILPNADHIFVQSQTMLDMIAYKGIASEKMTPVPMGVDLEALQHTPIPSGNPLLKGKRVLVYLGTLDRVRQINILFNMLVIVREEIPNILLVLAGDTEDEAHRAWLKYEAQRLGVSEQVIWTGWLPMPEAWRYLAAAEIGLSPFPRGFLLDMASPTKAVEYMAFGLPVVANNNPDQARVIQESDAGICVELTPKSFAKSVIYLLNNTVQCSEMAKKGRAYITKKRGYDSISNALAQKYQQLLSEIVSI